MSSWRTVLIGLCLIVSYVSARRMGVTHLMNNGNPEELVDAKYNKTINGRNYNMYYHAVPIDHFAYHVVDTFSIRYLVNNDFYQKGGPIFFYTGNEGNVESFVANTGIMIDLAAKFNAALVFGEHRYYGAGESHPYGPNAYEDAEHLGFLTSEQALADYATLLLVLMGEERDATEHAPAPYPEGTPVIAFGGSYGGMLAAWFRMKYPHMVKGAWAASAPLKYFNGGGVDWGAFDKVTTRTYQESGCNVENIRNGWDAIVTLSNTTDGRSFLNNLFTTDAKSPIQDINGGYMLNDYIREAIEYMAMTDYPYTSSFLTAMPGFPTFKACGFIGKDTINDPKTLATNLFLASSLYYNYTGKLQTSCINPATCGDPATAALGDPLGWPWQECTEIVIEMCARGGTNDMFWNECGQTPMTVLMNTCKQLFRKPFGWMAESMRVDAVKQLYGLDMSSYSNIVLSQGHLDPWSSGGYTAADKGINGPSGVYAMEIGGAAHHLDLRLPNTCDPEPVKNARYQIVNIIQCWLTDGCQNPTLTPLPEFKLVVNADCKDVINGYPWGQNPPSGNQTPTTPSNDPTTTPKSTEDSTKSASPLSATLSLLAAALFAFY